MFRECALSRYLQAVEAAFGEEGLMSSPGLPVAAHTEGAGASLRVLVGRAQACGVEERSDCAALMAVWLSAGLGNDPAAAWLQPLLDDAGLSGRAKVMLLENRLAHKAASNPDVQSLVARLHRLRVRFD